MAEAVVAVVVSLGTDVHDHLRAVVEGEEEEVEVVDVEGANQGEEEVMEMLIALAQVEDPGVGSVIYSRMYVHRCTMHDMH